MKQITDKSIYLWVLKWLPVITAEALALLNQNNGLNSAIGGCNFLRVARYSAPQPCSCDTCCKYKPVPKFGGCPNC